MTAMHSVENADGHHASPDVVGNCVNAGPALHVTTLWMRP